MFHCSSTRDDRRERIVAAGNSVRQALQELLSEYMENQGKKPSEHLDEAIHTMLNSKSHLRILMLFSLDVTSHLCLLNIIILFRNKILNSFIIHIFLN